MLIWEIYHLHWCLGISLRHFPTWIGMDSVFELRLSSCFLWIYFKFYLEFFVFPIINMCQPC